MKRTQGEVRRSLLYTSWNSPKTESEEASERGISISLGCMTTISRALWVNVPILVALEAALSGAACSAGGGVSLVTMLLDIVGEPLLDLDGGGAVGDGFHLKHLVLLGGEHVIALSVVASLALQEGGLGMAAARGSAPAVGCGVERGLGDDALEVEGKADEGVGLYGVLSKFVEDFILHAKESANEIGILHLRHYAHSCL